MVKEVLEMSHQELYRVEVLKLIEEKRITQIQGAQQLLITTRKLGRIHASYKKDGVKGIISKHRGKSSNNKFSKAFKDQIIAIFKNTYADFGPTFAHEKLTECHNLQLSVESLRKIMIEYGVWQAKTKNKKTIHQRRPPRSRFGELLQIDGSQHDWFEGRAPICTLLVFIDDATSSLTDMRFYPTETTQGYMELMKAHLINFGRPVAIYSDRHSIFLPNAKKSKDKKAYTQFNRAMKTLDINPILAKTPQAKGRVERANKTLQDRLVKEMRLNKINTMQQANEFLERFRLDYNKRFANAPLDKEDAHRNVLHNKRELDLILSLHDKRQVTKSLEFFYHKRVHQIDKKATHVIHKSVTICDLFGNELVVVYQGKELDFKVFDKKIPAIIEADEKTINNELDELLKKEINISHKAYVDAQIGEN